MTIRSRFALLSVFWLTLLLAFASGGPAKAAIDLKSELNCLALNIYFEARGESLIGMRAVAHVVMNRVDDPRFPDTICGVVRQGGESKLHRCQFSWWCDGRSDRPKHDKAWERSKALARAVFWGYSPDPTDGALWYHSRKARPIWRKALVRGPAIGRHIFYLVEHNA
jgi:spore germination cell wall hydrolase CwlJ-like protein